MSTSVGNAETILFSASGLRQAVLLGLSDSIALLRCPENMQALENPDGVQMQFQAAGQAWQVRIRPEHSVPDMAHGVILVCRIVEPAKPAQRRGAFRVEVEPEDDIGVSIAGKECELKDLSAEGLGVVADASFCAGTKVNVKLWSGEQGEEEGTATICRCDELSGGKCACGLHVDGTSRMLKRLLERTVMRIQVERLKKGTASPLRPR